MATVHALSQERLRSEMTDSDLKLLLTITVEAAGMIAIAWVYASDRIPADGSRLVPRRTPVPVVVDVSHERRRGRRDER